MVGRIQWLALNVRDFTVEQWEAKHVIPRAKAAGIQIIPWGRLTSPKAQGGSLLDAQKTMITIVNAARRWGSTWILPNLEQEAVDTCTPAQAKQILLNTGWAGKTGWSTQGWLPGTSGGGQGGCDFSPINSDPVLLQIFPEDLNWAPHEIPQKQADCIWHARVDKGFKYVSVTYQTYRSSTSWFDLTGNHSVFTGDGLSARGEWDDWFPPKS